MVDGPSARGPRRAAEVTVQANELRQIPGELPAWRPGEGARPGDNVHVRACRPARGEYIMKFRVTRDPDPLPKAEYDGHLYDFETREGAYGEFLLWTFRVYSNGSSQLVTSTTPTKFGTSSKECRFVEALRGEPVREGEEIDLGALLGNACRVQVDVKARKDGNGVINTVVNVLRPAPSLDALDPKDLPHDNPFA
jgi:hypothetical protein